MLTSQAIAEFMASRSGLRPRTQGEYEKHLALFKRAFPDLPGTPEPIQSWINSFKLAPETVNARLSTIKAFYKMIHARHPWVKAQDELDKPTQARDLRYLRYLRRAIREARRYEPTLIKPYKPEGTQMALAVK